MGTAQSAQDYESSSKFMKELGRNYQYFKDANDPRFGPIQLYQRRTEGDPRFIMGISQLLPNDDITNQFLVEIGVRSNLKHKNLIRIIGCEREGEDNICGVSNKFTVYCEWYQNNLERELDKRSKHQVRIYKIIGKRISIESCIYLYFDLDPILERSFLHNKLISLRTFFFLN